MNPISNNYSYFNNQNPYYYSGGSNSNANYNTHYEEPQNNSDQAAKAVGLAGLLQVVALGLQKGSQVLASRLAGGKEFTTHDNVVKVAEDMVKKNKLDVHVGFIDNLNKGAYAQRFGLGNELDIVAKGQNAFFTDKLKLAVAPKSKPSLILHELGHAINAKGFLTRILQKSRRYAGYAPMALILASSLAPERKDGKKNFVERNAGILGFSAFLPTIVEEGLASFRGIKAAKKVLNNPATLNILKKNYAVALATYVLAGLGLGIACKQTMLFERGKV